MNRSQSGTTAAASYLGNDSSRGFLERKAKVLAVGIVLLAAVLRLAVTPVLTMYSDEATTVAVARFGFGDLLACKAFDIGNPQGFHLFLSAVRQVFGENILLYRLINAAIGTAAVAIIMILCRRLAPHAAVWLGVGLLTAVNPMHLVFSLQLRPWAVQMLTLALAAWAVLRWRGDHRAGALGVYVAAMFVAVNTNYSAVFFWAAIGLWWLWDDRRSAKGLMTVVLVNLLLLALLIPTGVFLWWQVHHQEIVRGGKAWMFHLFGFPYFFIYGNSVARPERGVWLMAITAIPAVGVMVPLLLAGLRAAWKTVVPRSFVPAMLFVPFFMLAGICLFKPFFFSRYLAFIWPVFALTLVLGLGAFRKGLRWAGWALLLAMELAGCAGYALRYVDDYPPLLYQTLQAQAGKDFAVLIYPLGERQLATQWHRGPITILRVDKIRPEPTVMAFPHPPAEFVRFDALPQRTLSALLAEGLPEEVWFYCDLHPATSTSTPPRPSR